jgi:hypothetical protein
MAIGGSAIALGTLIGAGWGSALGVEVFTALATVGYFVLGGRDSDFGAIFGSRPDERQTGIGVQASAMAGNAMAVVALGGVIIASAMGRLVWPFALLCAVGGATYVLGLLIYRRR